MNKLNIINFKINLVIFFIINIFGVNFSSAQNYYKGTIDTVYYFKPGEGQSNGQSSEFFPKNIFGVPSSKATKTIPENSESEICSLGLGGEIIVGFKNAYLYDGDGDDFIVFENAFISPINNKVFAEPALVSVSENGIDYIEFPVNHKTLEGCAGTNPSNGSADVFDPLVSGGNSFDLSKIGLKRIKYIKIKDYCIELLKDSSNTYYDPIISGFDLDAVTARYLLPDETSIFEENEQNFITFFSDYFFDYIDFNNCLYKIFAKNPGLKEIEIYNYSGNRIYINSRNQSYKSNYLDKGVYLMIVKGYSGLINFKKILLLN